MVLRPILSLLFASLLLAGPLFSDELEGLPVREIRIETAAINQQHLQELLAIQPNDAYSAGKVRQSIRRLYATGRFLDIQVDAQRQADGLTLTFITRENYFVGGVFVAGVRGSPNRGQLVNGTGLQFGELWTEGKRERAVEGLRRLLEEHGFYQARIEPRVELHPEIQQVNIHFEIQAGERAHITQVQVTGAPGFPRETVLRAAKLKPGQQVTPQRLQKAVRRLRNYYRKRTYLEADIGVAERRYLPEENGLLPVLEVNRGPQVEVNVVGAKLSGSKRRELLPIYTEGSVDADLVREGKNNLQDFYQRRGHFDVEVEAHIREEPSAKEPKDGKVVVEYRVAPGPDHQVELVEISGNHYFDMATLRERMLVAEKGLISDGRFSSDLLRRDMGAIRSLYVANGFRNVQVASEVLDDYQDKLGHIAVRLRVDEGPQMLVRKLTIEGAQGIPAQQLRTRVACDDGQPFSDFNVLLDRATLLSQYFNRGFPEATFSWEVKPVHGGQEQVDLIYKISEGPRQYVDRVLISGLDTTRRYIVDQQLLLEEGEPLSQLDILETQRRLYDFGIFEKVEIAVQNREGKEKFKNAMVQIEEGGRYTVSVGGGVDVARFRGATEEATDPEGEAGISPLVSFEVTRLNFRGRNHTLSFKSRLSRLQERVLASYTAPRFWNEPRLTLLLSGFAERSFDVLTFASQRVEGSIALQQKRGRSDTLLYRYSYRRVKAERDTLKVSVEDIPLFARPVRVGMLGATFVRDRRDDPVDPYRGMLLTSDVGFSSARLGSEANFSRFVGQFSTYHRLGQNLVLARNTQLGVAEPFGKPGKVLNEQGGPDIPLPERFFSGGGNSHRGFGVNQAGPRDRETGFPVGGRVLLLNSLELRFPVSGKKVGGVLFHDMGNLFARLDDISFRVKQRNLTDFSYMVHAVGAGVRYKTPIGPLRLGRTGLQITRLHWETPRSSLSLSGQIFASAQPRILLNYEAGLDVGEIAAVSQISELRSGRLQLKGQLSYDAAGKVLDSSADLRLERLSLALPAFRLSGIYGTGKVHATREFIEIPDLRLLLLGGEVVGNFRADQLGGEPKLSLAGKARGLSVSRLTHALATRQRPLTKLRWAGAVDGEVKAQFLLGASDAAPDLQVESDLSVRPPSVTPPSLLPVSGQGELGYASGAGQLVLRNVSLETPASRISGEGVWATGPNSEHNLQLNLSTSDFQEWAPLVAAWRSAEAPPAEAPIALERQGQAQLRGTLRGSAIAPRLEGRLETTDFRYERTHWTGFATNLAYSPKLLRLTDAQLRRGSSVVGLNFTARLERGEFTDASHLHLEAVAENAELADLAGLTGTAYPMTGRVTASLQAQGTAGEAQGGGWVRINSGTLAGESFDLLRGELNFAQGELRITNIALTKGSGKITGEAEYRPADGGYQFQLDGAGLALSEISRLRSPRFALGGRVGFRASGAGVPERPRIEATVEVSDLEVNEERIGKLTGAIQTRDGRLEARLKSQLVRGNIAGSMSVHPTGEFPAQGSVELTGVDLDPLFNWLIRGRLTAHSASTGSISISGPLKKPESLLVAAEIRELRIAIEQVELRNEGPLRASLRDGRIQIEPASLAGTQTNVSVAGWLRVMGPPAERALELHTEGEMNMALLPTLNPELIGSGTVKLDATATGTLQRPLLTGRVQIHNGGVAFKGFPTGLSKMEGSLLFDTRRVRIEKLTAEAGGGKVLLSGFMEYANSPPVLRLRAEAERVRLRYPPGTSSLLNASLSLDGTAEHSVLTGNVVVTRANLSPRSDVASILGFVQESGSTPVTTRVLHTLHLDVKVTSSPGLRLELANTHDLEIQANLRLRGTAARPAVLGRIELLQGEIMFAGTRYIVGRSDISFVDPFRVKPEVNLHLQTRAQQFDIFITLTGPLDRLNATYRSEPPLPGSDVQALLITGRAREGATTTQSAQSFSAVGTSAILEQALSAAVGSRIDRLFGAGRVKIAPHVGGSQTNPGARLTVEQQVTPDVRFTYITNLTSTQQQVIQVEWTINRRWSLNAVRDRNGLFGVDFKWRKQFR